MHIWRIASPPAVHQHTTPPDPRRPNGPNRSRRGCDRNQRFQHRAGVVGGRIAGRRSVPDSAVRDPGRRARVRGCARPRFGGTRGRRQRGHPPVLHHVVAARHRGRELPGQQRHAGQHAGGVATDVQSAARGPRDRPPSTISVRSRRTRRRRRTHRFGRARTGCHFRISTTTRRTFSSLPPTSKGSPGRCTVRTRWPDMPSAM